jgi:class 3 adenylate cyclase
MTAMPASLPAAKPERPRWRIGVGLALTALTLVAVLATALAVHLSWSRTAERNVDTAAASLSASTASAVGREIDNTFHGAEGALEIVRSILFQGALKADDEVKREFVFLSVLRSLPAASWIGFGFGDGRFFGSHALDDGTLEMVEIGSLLANGKRFLRVDHYRPLPGDIYFERREKGESAYVAMGQPWYRTATSAKAPVWSRADLLPSGFEPATVVSTRLELFGRFQGVLMVSLNLSRVSKFLADLDIAKDGIAMIEGENGRPVAASYDLQEEGGKAALAQAFIGGAGTAEVPDIGQVYVTITPLGFNDWTLKTAVPRSAFTAEIDRNTRRLVYAIAVLAALAAAIAALLAQGLFARPIRRIAGELKHIESFALSDVRQIPSRLTELDDLSGALKRMAGSLAAFALYVPTEIVRKLVAQGVEPKPGGETREISVFFADLPGFTTLTERYGAGTVPFLTQFLTLATEAVHREGGTVDKFIGDCIMAFWNAPTPEPEHALKACRAALAIREGMAKLEPPGGRGGGPAIRIGINTGPAIVGHVGSTQRLSYTAIGDTVNVASRFEALGKEYGVEIIVGAATAKALGGSLKLRPLGESPIRGRGGAVEIFELLG